MAYCDATAIFCEDIRHELSGQLTLVGVFTRSLAIKRQDSTIPLFSVYAIIHFSIDFEVNYLSLKIISTAGETVISDEADLEEIQSSNANARRNNDPLFGVLFGISLASFAIEQSGTIQAIINVNGDETVCGSLRVTIADEHSD